MRIAVFNALLALLVLGCKGEEKAKPAADAAAVKPDAAPVVPDAAVKLPIEPRILARALPDPPAPIMARPGAPAVALKKASGLKPSPYSKNILVAQPAEGPFSSVHYRLDGEGKRLEAVLATFRPDYAKQADKVRAAFTERLGAGEAFAAEANKGQRWSVVGHAIELREDSATGDLELQFVRR